ncbi:type IV pilus biogenesis/stability protein PilW [Erwinia sp. OLTSP20]|uniref:type IV pilus biogenesis/stability protein PilW n=1 Tax=unclassified Erwinia TaxID=2622719 RepID=UPI000C19DA35|nr:MULTISPECIES: type IV pilus biogenesis/stability protein PilW [unclassified Erwinia]PIJ52311.1 type IV pilus biogenesis/stability protein PilW [Erwinia sp. OAMSP11]PIJ73520.1 type IV pilus biogenesis/stability protein PilW [Erwinia sp. OLSSP12]PIJ85337.1 type IV pilus biogenesis/stability protein PilW [Erwinia sp. OLCASP19]PIJ87579.1 type IV pilus biogenesis/stability protein PilW [Erwinia sp. OLMTSP26]PIJ89086.1 type IV pilus biogenesis/stability protein PilW [Erwinia sp. OLMDSP33]
MGKGLPVLVTLSVLLCGCQQTARQQALAETRLQLGLALMARNAMSAAAQNLDEAERLAPNDYRVQLAQARYQQQSGHQQQAAWRYRKLLKITADNGYVLNNYGAFLCSLGQYEAAQQQFTAALHSLQPGARADSFDNAGYCYLKAGQMTLARQAFASAVKADPEKANLMLAEASWQFSQGQREQSRLLLEVYQRQAPATAESLWLQIRFAASEGRSRDVKHYAAWLAQRFPQSSQYQQLLANEY